MMRLWGRLKEFGRCCISEIDVRWRLFRSGRELVEELSEERLYEELKTQFEACCPSKPDVTWTFPMCQLHPSNLATPLGPRCCYSPGDEFANIISQVRKS